MEKIIGIGFVLFLILVPFDAKAINVNEPGPGCDVFSQHTASGAFQNYQSHEYVNGLLKVHFKFNELATERSLKNKMYFYRPSDCQTANQFEPFNINVQLPNNINNFSIQFVKVQLTNFDFYEYKIFNDDTNLPLTCLGCSPKASYIFWPGYSRPHKVRFQLTANDTLASKFTSTAIDIEEPENLKTPILIIPGIMGTEIVKETEFLWPDVSRMFFSSDDSFMYPLSFKDDATPLDTSLSVSNVIKNAGTLNYTAGLINDLNDQNYLIGQNLFTFPYDWRKDLRETSNVDLKNKIDEVLSATGASKVNIIAHSQGGLVIKRLLYDTPSYKQKVERLVFVGTPHLGAPKAAKALLYGDSMGVEFLGMGLDPEAIKRIGRNMPSVYQLLPSEEYFNHSNGYLGTAKTKLSLFGNTTTLELKNYTDSKQYLKDQDLNSLLIDGAEQFHNASYDNFNFNGSGIETYNIIGCQTATIGKVFAKKNGKFDIHYTAGDKTVPVLSASNVFGATTYFVRKADHGSMMTQDGSRQLITSIATGGAPTFDPEHISVTSSECEFNGTKVSIHSPVDLHIYNSKGNHTGPNGQGGYDLEIPGVSYDIIGEEKFVFLPAGDTYKLRLVGTGTGSFSLYSSQIVNGDISSTAYYHNVPIVPEAVGEVFINETNTQDVLLDVNNDGATDHVIPPSSLLHNEETLDVTAPITSAEFTGQEGEAGYFRSGVGVALNAQDPTDTHLAAAGVLVTKFKINDQLDYMEYTEPLLIEKEGMHTIRFYSVDNIGNEEEVRSVQFVIDKSEPEAVIRWSQELRDISINGTDNVTLAPFVADGGSTVTITDQAGNATVLSFSNNDRKQSLKTELLSLSYNGVSQTAGKNTLAFVWKFDKQGVLASLIQRVESKQEFFILGHYDGNNTAIRGKGQSGLFDYSNNGLKLLLVKTKEGELEWE